MKRTTPQRIDDIKEQVEKIIKATEGKILHQFEEDYVLSAAVLRWFEIIGEATKYVPNELKLKYPDIPWRQMAGMRDIAIHDYADLKLDRIWKTIRQDIPKLKKQIEEIELS